MKAKAYYFTSNYHGCNYVRALLPMYQNGWLADVEGLIGDRKLPATISAELKDSNVAVFHRPDTGEANNMGAILKKQYGMKVVFDNDDTFQLEKDKTYGGKLGEDFKSKMKIKQGYLNAFLKGCDLVTCSTEHLAKEYREITDKPVIVLPNYIDEFDWATPKRNNGDKVRIGIVGSVAYYNDFEIIQDYLKELHDTRDDVQIVLFGLNTKQFYDDNGLVKKVFEDEHRFWSSMNKVDHTPFVDMNKYFNTLNDLELDMMLIPRKDSYFNRAKSNLKFLEAGMCEIPCIAQTFSTKDSPYDNDIDGENGLLFTDVDDLRAKVDELVKDKDKRRAMGKKAREYVLNNYRIEDHAHKWREAYESIL